MQAHLGFSQFKSCKTLLKAGTYIGNELNTSIKLISFIKQIKMIVKVDI